MTDIYRVILIVFLLGPSISQGSTYAQGGGLGLGLLTSADLHGLKVEYDSKVLKSQPQNGFLRNSRVHFEWDLNIIRNRLSEDSKYITERAHILGLGAKWETASADFGPRHYGILQLVNLRPSSDIDKDESAMGGRVSFGIDIPHRIQKTDTGENKTENNFYVQVDWTFGLPNQDKVPFSPNYFNGYSLSAGTHWRGF